MKLSLSSLRRGLCLTAFALITCSAVSAAETFEGRIHMEIASGKKKEKMGIDYSMKAGKLRMDPKMPEGQRHEGGMGMIMDMPAHEMIILMEMEGGRCSCAARSHSRPPNRAARRAMPTKCPRPRSPAGRR
ncbi:MAG: hypothetical protein DUW69_000816 [Verrucomicrobia bacterium]|nr:MAG: hypothetical protein DUW69_000816 [Verrucomicrobiota bacterium]